MKNSVFGRWWRFVRHSEDKGRRFLAPSHPLFPAASPFDKTQPKSKPSDIQPIVTPRGNMDRLHFPSLFTREDYLGKSLRADWQNTNLAIRYFACSFVELLRKEGLPFYVNEAFRSAERQKKLHDDGFSQTLAPMAAHYQGEAVDIVHAVHYWDLSKDEWQYVGQLGKRAAERLLLPITWGGDWHHPDPAHWEIDGWRERAFAVVNHGEPIRFSPPAMLSSITYDAFSSLSDEQLLRKIASS